MGPLTAMTKEGARCAVPRTRTRAPGRTFCGVFFILLSYEPDRPMYQQRQLFFRPAALRTHRSSGKRTSRSSKPSPILPANTTSNWR